ncbi:hypothetical protein ACWD5F_03575 [Streptomyces sp. NPDC002499]
MPASAPLSLPTRTEEAALIATVLMTAGPSACPNSRTRLVAPLAMPVMLMGTAFTAAEVSDETTQMKPTPSSSTGPMKAARDVEVMGSAAIQN